MARIFYGIQGDHNGHINRALSVAELLTEHELFFVGGGNAARAREAGHAFEELPVMGTAVRDNSVQKLATVGGMLKKRLGQGPWLRRLREIIRDFDPDLILTDYEYYTPRAAKAEGRPCYSLDHQHVLTGTSFPPIPGQAMSRFCTVTLMNLLLPGLAGCLVTSFYQPPLKRPERDSIFGPLPRADALAMRPMPGEHALVYLPGCDPAEIGSLFGGRKREYRLYGFGLLPPSGNLTFRPASREGFLADLASSQYVVCSGGHGTLTEALLLGKPCLCFPGHFLYEQYWNCFFLQELGYGRFFPGLAVNPREVDDFEASLQHFAGRIAQGDFNGRDTLRSLIGRLLSTGGRSALI